MKYILTFILALTMALPISACNEDTPQDERQEGQKEEQKEQKKFDPERYQRELEAYLCHEACLTKQEAQAIFPLFREMQQKQRAIYMKKKVFDKAALCDNKAAEAVILAYDERELAIKKLQQQYHKQFMKVIPATKVLKLIRAEERFNRNMMRHFSRRPQQPHHPKGNK
jgi:hypothetical protein